VRQKGPSFSTSNFWQLIELCHGRIARTLKMHRKRTWMALGVVILALGACRSPDAAGSANHQEVSSVRPSASKHGALVYRGLEAFRVSPDGRRRVAADNTGPFGRSWSKSTNLGLDLLTQLVAERTALVSAASSADRVDEVLSTLEELRTFRGLFPEFIKLEGPAHAEVKAGRIRYSTIDSAWVTVALSIASARYRVDRPELTRRAQALIEKQDYSSFLKSNLLSDGVSIDAVSGAIVEPGRFSYGDRNSEARPLVLALIGLQLLPPTVWDAMSYAWTERASLPVAEGYRASAFVELTGQLFFDEMRLAPHSLGLSHRNYVEASARVARAKQHVVFGYAPSCEPPDGYAEFGLDRPDVVTPYAAAELATTGLPLAAQNLTRVLDALDWSGGPVADALDPSNAHTVCPTARMLDQSLLFLALNADALRDLARASPWYASAEARLRDMDRTHAPPAVSIPRAADIGVHRVGG